MPKGAYGSAAAPISKSRRAPRREGEKHMIKILAGLALGLASAPVHAQECYNRLTQDLNCNAVDATDEVAVDLEDPTCAGNVDEDGNPYPNADFYV